MFKLSAYWKNILIYALVMAALLASLKLMEYRYLIGSLKVEFYIGTIAFLFTVIGVWLGLNLLPNKTQPEAKREKTEDPLKIITYQEFGLNKREFEVLQLIAAGYSNQEIADKLFIALPTVKTHASNLYAKLDVKRRTQAIQKAKELQLIT